MKVYNNKQLILIALSIATFIVFIALILDLIRGDFELNVGYLKTSLFEVLVVSLITYLLLLWNNDGFEG